MQFRDGYQFSYRRFVSEPQPRVSDAIVTHMRNRSTKNAGEKEVKEEEEEKAKPSFPVFEARVEEKEDSLDLPGALFKAFVLALVVKVGIFLYNFVYKEQE